MKRAWPWIAATLALTAAFHLLTIYAYPYFKMVELGRRGKGSANTIFHRSRVSAESRQVVRPSPDLIYSGCGYDLSKHPLKISATVPQDTYWSVSMFAANTDNFFVLNDKKARGKKVEIILFRKGADYREGENVTSLWLWAWMVTRNEDYRAEMVESPSTRGLVLFRMLITDESKVQDLIRTQKMASCQSVE
ncbi:MAG TPA: DUF1254 domain-containing protein [bacterium]|nr:DUF1254 domain-containing protein [bacterium]